MSAASLRLAVIPGDGIGTEVVAEGLTVLRAALGDSVALQTTDYDLGARRYHATGEVLPDSVLDELRGHDAILLGAVGDPSVPPGVLERGLLLKLRFALDHHVNLRPVKLYPGVATPITAGSPETIDFVVVREGTEGPYAGTGGVLRQGTPHEVATEESLNTAYGVERVVRVRVRSAPRRARASSSPWCTRPTCSSTPAGCGSAWSTRSARVPRRHRGLPHVDAATIFFVTAPAALRRHRHRQPLRRHPHRPRRGHRRRHRARRQRQHRPQQANPSMFEPVHGSAPDIAGQGKADPTATVLSVAMLLDHLGFADEAGRVEAAVAADLAERAGLGQRSTREIGEALAARVAG